MTDNDGKTSEITAKNFIIATGSVVTSLPGVVIDEKHILSSTGVLELDKVPESMLVVGGGVIGLEMASVWSNYGCKVTVLEFLDRIFAPEDDDVSKEMEKIFTKKGIKIRKVTKLNSVKINETEDCIEATIEDIKNNKITNEKFSKVLISVGRKANIEGLGLDNAGVK